MRYRTENSYRNLQKINNKQHCQPRSPKPKSNLTQIRCFVTLVNKSAIAIIGVRAHFFGGGLDKGISFKIYKREKNISSPVIIN